ncbi:immunoglobulin superfamily member 1-like [Strix uralensis]|uniref:immunoglobulin superfamily member 1-like n=1 Tax=Strix uralensis TaxID=36305 RepID=UPI003DA3FB99
MGARNAAGGAGCWGCAGRRVLQCRGSGPEFFLFHGTRSEPSQSVTSRSGLVLFSLVTSVTLSDAGTYYCRCQEPPNPRSPPSNTLEIVVTDPDLDPPQLSLEQLQQPLPRGSNVSVVCEGPPLNGTFRLYRGGPEGVVGQQQVAGGGSVSFSLGPLHPRDEGAYVCTYSPERGGVSAPSPELLILVEGEGRGATPKIPTWPGCEYWKGPQ